MRLPTRHHCLSTGRPAIVAACLFLLPIIPPVVARADTKPPQALFLALPNDDDYTGGLLTRELIRQAVLMTARDEFGLIVRDAGMGEKFPNDSKLETTSLIVAVSSERSKGPVFRLSKSGAKKPVLLKAFRLSKPDSAHVTTHTTELEKLSRTEIFELLKEQGFESQVKMPADKVELPAKLQKGLGWNGMLAQLAVIRDLQAELRKSNGSTSVLGPLARAYAHLGVLTEVLWSPTHEVYKARALLYAERWVAKSPSADSYNTRAYVRALVGMHQGALDDLHESAKAAGKKVAEIVKDPEPNLIDAYCRGDFKRLLAATSTKDEAASLAAYFLLFIAESVDSNGLKERAGDLFDKLPVEPFRALDSQINNAPLGLQRGISKLCIEEFPKLLYRDVSAITDLPENLREIVASPPKEPHLERPHRIKLMNALRAVQDTSDDAGEPTLAVGANLIRDINFQHAWRILSVQRFTLSWNVDETTLKDQTPLVEGHPFAKFIDCHVWDTRSALPAARELLKPRLSDLEGTQEPLYAFLQQLGAEQASAMRGISLAHDDPVFRDLADFIRRSPEEELRQAATQTLREVSPMSSIAIVASIAHDWEYAESQAAEWEKDHADDPVVQEMLGQRYVALGQADDAERCFKRRIAALPDYTSYELLANLYLQRGDEQKWVETLDESLKLPSKGLEAPGIRVTLARHFMKKNDLKRALPYADQAADSAAGWAFECAADCHEQAGDWKKAEEYVQAKAKRYGEQGLAWYLWCRRTGQGDVAAARDLGKKQLESYEQSDNPAEREIVALYHYAEGDLEKALKILKEIHTLGDDPAYGLQAALIAAELKRPEERDALLKAAYATSRRQGGWFADVVHDFQNSLLKKDPIPVDLKENDRRIRLKPDGAQTKLSYFLGQFLLLHGRQEEALPLLQLAASSPYYTLIEATYAGISLARLKAQRQPLRPVERDPELEKLADILAFMESGARPEAADLKMAYQEIDEVLEKHPNSVDALYTRALIFANDKRLADATEDVNQCLEKFPSSVDLIHLHATLQELRGGYDEAAKDYERSIKIDPHRSETYFRLATILATCPDEAVRDGKRAVELVRQHCMGADAEIEKWNQYLTLACALAEAGDFPEAVKQGEESVKRAPQELKPQITKIVQLFRDGTAFRKGK